MGFGVYKMLLSYILIYSRVYAVYFQEDQHYQQAQTQGLGATNYIIIPSGNKALKD